jgi:hypothetical protein
MTLGWLNTTSDRSSDESSRTESDAVVARDRHDGTAVAVYTGRPRLFARLWAVPGARRGQVGDQEARGLVLLERLPEVASLIQAHRRRSGRPLTSEQALKLRARARIRATSAGSEPV